MAHVVADRVKETTTTTGTGNVTLAGASSGHKAFSAVCANNDTFFYCIAHQSANEWEVGYGTYVSATPAVARTTVIASSNSDTSVTFSAGTKDVFITSPAVGQGWGMVTASPAANQNDYAPTGMALANMLYLTPSATIKITGLAGGYAGRQIRIINASTDYLVWLESENASSTAANRFTLGVYPIFLMPGDSVSLYYDATSSRWRVAALPSAGPFGLTYWDDMHGAPTASVTSGNIGLLAVIASGTGAGVLQSLYGVNTTEKAAGVMDLTSGTTATGRAHIGAWATGNTVPTLGPALFVARVAINTAVDGTNTFSVNVGWHDNSAGTMNDGVVWEYRWTGAAVEWSQTRFAATVATRANTGSPTGDTTYIWCIIFMNANWTRADMIYSQDSAAFTLASSPTTGIPSNTQLLSPGVSMVKTVGTTARIASVDFLGWRYDYVRG